MTVTLVYSVDWPESGDRGTLMGCSLGREEETKKTGGERNSLVLCASDLS